MMQEETGNKGGGGSNLLVRRWKHFWVGTKPIYKYTKGKKKTVGLGVQKTHYACKKERSESVCNQIARSSVQIGFQKPPRSSKKGQEKKDQWMGTTEYFQDALLTTEK